VIGNQNVINLVRVGIDELDILTIISANETEFSLTEPDVKKLKRAGVSERILQAMIQKQQAASPVNRDAPPLDKKQERTEVASEQPPTAPKSPPPQKAGRVKPPEPVSNVENEESRSIEEPSPEPAATDVTGDSEVTEEEKRLIEEFEAEPAVEPDGETMENRALAEEEKRLIEEFEAKKAKKPEKH
jgi:hypothetical protein